MSTSSDIKIANDSSRLTEVTGPGFTIIKNYLVVLVVLVVQVDLENSWVVLDNRWVDFENS